MVNLKMRSVIYFDKTGKKRAKVFTGFLADLKMKKFVKTCKKQNLKVEEIKDFSTEIQPKAIDAKEVSDIQEELQENGISDLNDLKKKIREM